MAFSEASKEAFGGTKLKRRKRLISSAEANTSSVAASNVTEPSNPVATANILQNLPFRGPQRTSTVTVALPCSILATSQTLELRAYLVGQIARSLTIFGVDEVIIYEDYGATDDKRLSNSGFSSHLEFFVRNLQYLETPQYLRRYLFDLHSDLKHAGMQNPVDAPHHLRKHEWLPYREGVVVDNYEEKPMKLMNEKCVANPRDGSWIYCGLSESVWIPDSVAVKTRVTVKLDSIGTDSNFKAGRGFLKTEKGASMNYGCSKPLRGTAVSPNEPPTTSGLYWGYKVNAKACLQDVFDACSFSNDKRFDLVIGTSQNGVDIDQSFTLPHYKNLLLVFGALDGLETILERKSSKCKSKAPNKVFDMYLNICPFQRSRTIRTEEALPISLSVLRPHLLANDLHDSK